MYAVVCFRVRMNMEHISHILLPRRRQFEQLEAQRRSSLFAAPREKGSGEWASFDGVRESRVDIFRVRTPKKVFVIAERPHVLRIVYPSRIRPTR